MNNQGHDFHLNLHQYFHHNIDFAHYHFQGLHQNLDICLNHYHHQKKNRHQVLNSHNINYDHFF